MRFIFTVGVVALLLLAAGSEPNGSPVSGETPSISLLPWAFAYIGPDLLLPFTSAIAGIVGIVLMFWQRLAAWVRSLWRLMSRRKA